MTPITSLFAFASLLFSDFVIASPLSVHIGPVSRTVRCPNGDFADQRCCPFHSLRDDLQSQVFHNSCGGLTPKALRASFHDAIGLSKSGGVPGGADGSLLQFRDTELTYVANAGVKTVIQTLVPFQSKYNISAGDLLQFAAIVGVSNCPGSPQFKFMAGRPAPKKAAPDNLIISPADSVDEQLARFSDAGFSSTDAVALLGSHSMAHAPIEDPSIPDPGAPLDITPTTLDTQFYLDVLFKGTGFPGGSNNFAEVKSGLPNQGELRLQSDQVMARDGRTACQWQGYINNQGQFSNDFGNAMFKMALNGQPKDKMFDCSDAVPKARPLNGKSASFPKGKSVNDVEKSCPSKPFPKL